ncbi:hypothetical protein G6F70_003481 [Rhizopus microsporus]|uniref:NADH-cytochrome b5 reductase n=2 Tax=Rhizopus TaxID=4842 RepID=A0A367KCF9_RHIAZ|nr:hypothetical protein G6F71_000055 [Rhizopus microsporus]RCH99858.1 NADH-cytochrome b5 reductase [Rhizopus azygosporus]KAG1201062.1 hypothetical protein G6F70_003481 [Rhizopus microsporus]KAG1213014.1 hypothetical protein G6F69_003204 [Rhizopus microsporus]KAG1238660.1 hypothetical protein G6F67_000245 [Rhizopus microsporus]
MVFSPSEFRPFTLEKIVRINHNVSLFRFKLPKSTDVAGLPVASCVLFRSHITKDGKSEEVVRPYTPTSVEAAEGHVDFVIKDYPQGNMSRHVHSLKVGDTIDIKGPFEKYKWENKPVEYVGMVAGGTGITPMLQLLRKIFSTESPYKNTKVTLLFGNQEERDILFRDELEGYQRDYPDRFKVIHVLERAPENWSGPKGFITQDLIQQSFHHPDVEDSIIFVCGPPPLMEAISGDKNPDKSQGTLRGFLKSLGYIQDRVYKM